MQVEPKLNQPVITDLFSHPKMTYAAGRVATFFNSKYGIVEPISGKKYRRFKNIS